MVNGEGAIREWLEHCAALAVQKDPILDATLQRTDSEFEAQVIQALHAKGVSTIAQYPSCGFFIDIVAQYEDKRLAIECDGEVWHLDEHGQLKQEDCIRQEILERAGWRVLRIPYRGWRQDPDVHIQRVMRTLREPEEEEVDGVGEVVTKSDGKILKLMTYEAAIVHALRNGDKDTESVLRTARIHLGYARLGSDIRYALVNAITVLTRREYIKMEDNELFLAEVAREGEIVTMQAPRVADTSPYAYRRPRSRQGYRGYRRR
jgi:very-short-patch-repair endonuclease